MTNEKRQDGFLLKAYKMNGTSGKVAIYAPNYAEACKTGFGNVRRSRDDLTYREFLASYGVEKDHEPGEDFGTRIEVGGREAFMLERSSNQVKFCFRDEIVAMSSHVLDVEFYFDERDEIADESPSP